ncbi:hypothetical protein IJG79_02400 [Candidatus Saccharibacteria bacterium]|nr:hypothetical protein [Candidatus Saccharibacteria bacterium]
MTAKAYIDELNYEEFSKTKAISDNPSFASFLAGPNDDVVASAVLAEQCKKLGVPAEFVNTPSALHYFVVAVNNRLRGNA